LHAEKAAVIGIAISIGAACDIEAVGLAVLVIIDAVVTIAFGLSETFPFVIIETMLGPFSVAHGAFTAVLHAVDLTVFVIIDPVGAVFRRQAFRVIAETRMTIVRIATHASAAGPVCAIYIAIFVIINPVGAVFGKLTRTYLIAP